MAIIITLSQLPLPTIIKLVSGQLLPYIPKVTASVSVNIIIMSLRDHRLVLLACVVNKSQCHEVASSS